MLDLGHVAHAEASGRILARARSEFCSILARTVQPPESWQRAAGGKGRDMVWRGSRRSRRARVRGEGAKSSPAAQIIASRTVIGGLVWSPKGSGRSLPNRLMLAAVPRRTRDDEFVSPPCPPG